MVRFDYEEANQCGQIRMYVGQEELCRFDLENIHHLHIKRLPDFESLLIEFDPDHYVLPLELQTNPTLTITWGTSIELHR